DKFDLYDKVNDEQVKRLEDFCKDQLKNIPWLSACSEYPLVGVGGSFRNLGKIIRRKKKYVYDVTHYYEMNKADIVDVYEGIRKLNLDRRMKIKGLSNERADIFLVAVVAIKSVLDQMGTEKIILSGSGLRDGLIFQQILPNGAAKPVDSAIDFSVNNLVNQLEVDKEHCKRICDLSLSMFEQLKQLHKLPSSYEAIIKTAAMLHDSGICVGYYNHQRHSFYYILNSNLKGFTHREIIISAFAAASHRKDEVPKDFIRYMEILNEDDLTAILRIGVLIRIAESFDRSMVGIIQSVSCDVLGDSVIMKTETTGDASLEIKDALSSNDIFRKAYGKNLVIL
ncbi:MAG TPA: hypothetical protein PLZ84_07010, partial [Clostridia bacterium]|nr:hypothetical protein [Clostridia bacterium]